ncbi:MAG TPA: HD domain-containing protein [bacterium]|nr:HD domain-containing protein [bacterium]
METTALKNIMEVFLTLQVTKELPRQGFINFGFKRNESDSVAAHSFTVCALTYFLARAFQQEGKKINAEHALKIALVHDMGEAISGDIGYHVKRFAGKLLTEVEDKTMRMLVEKLPIQEEVMALYAEYNASETTEAKIVKFADSLDAWAQMLLTPGADMSRQVVFVEDKAKLMGDDNLFGNELANLFREACRMLKDRDVTFLGG